MFDYLVRNRKNVFTLRALRSVAASAAIGLSFAAVTGVAPAQAADESAVGDEQAAEQGDNERTTDDCAGSVPRPAYLMIIHLPAVAVGETVVPGETLTARIDPYWVNVSVWWFVDGQLRSDSANYTYDVQDSDVGKVIFALASLWRPERCGYAHYNAPSPPVTVVSPVPEVVSTPATVPPVADIGASDSSDDLAKSWAKATPVAKKVKKGDRAKIRVVVKTAGSDRVTGRVRVAWGSKVSQAVDVALKASANGKVTVKLPVLKPGTYRIKSSFVDPTGRTSNSSAKTVKIGVEGK
jgi:hypothetical protein